MGQKISDMNKTDVLRQGDKDRYIQEAEIEQDYKLLLLGAGEAGKTTIFKQLNLLQHSVRLSDESSSITLGFCRKLRPLLLVLVRLYGTTGDVKVDRDINNLNRNWYDEYLSKRGISYEGVDLISQIWNSKNAQEVWKHRNEFQLSESLEYFCQRENLNRMKDPYLEVVPDDYIHCAITTTGLVEGNVKINGQTIRVLDTGGQRSERSKWPGSFDGVSAIMFVVALDQFDQVLFEDTSINRWEETLNLFARTVNFSQFETTPFILMLNRVDLLEKKLAAKEKEKVNLDDYFPELALGTNYEEAVPQVLEYMEQQLLENLSPSQPYLVQYINAVDKEAFPQCFTNCYEWMESVC